MPGQAVTFFAEKFLGSKKMLKEEVSRDDNVVFDGSETRNLCSGCWVEEGCSVQQNTKG